MTYNMIPLTILHFQDNTYKEYTKFCAWLWSSLSHLKLLIKNKFL